MAPSLPKTYRAAVLDDKGTKLVLKDIDLKLPGPGQVLIKALACGVCHTDEFLRQGFLGNSFPRIPGHEVIGDIVAVGEGVTRVREGERVGGPWHGGHDGTCRSCQRGVFQTCDNEEINGVTMDGGYAEYVLLRAEAAVRIPSDVDPAEAAPLLCAGVTTFNSMRRMGVMQGGLVAVQGLGGLGHLAVQFASKMGYELGAHHYVDTSREDPVKALMKLGGAAMICSTAPHPKAISPLVGGLAPQGKLIVLAPLGPVEFDTATMVTKAASVHGWPSGHALDCEETIAFAGTHGVKCLIEKFPLDKVQEAFEHMTSGKVRFRAVLTI
ncbi:hypothetical protein INS49_003058 [Diaporthe citri]|uniref:uncharacterized protein n=1 Tax=Diaporthe citri TaxID=83186 RepID=UPI001C7F5364|nr:uncharacterized protein INS49_003058 [Diaporthe citri]KAG6368842.1 hypothetical protein INS49_003058 [Diaporthe citri]